MNPSIPKVLGKLAIWIQTMFIKRVRRISLRVSVARLGPSADDSQKIQLPLFLLFLSTQGLVSTLVHWRKERLSSHAHLVEVAKKTKRILHTVSQTLERCPWNLQGCLDLKVERLKILQKKKKKHLNSHSIIRARERHL